MSLYAWLNLLSVSIPFIASFHPRIGFYRHWPALFPAIILAMIPYVIWDVIFTRLGIWGFNDRYLSGATLLDLPVEEWMFFLCIPFSCIFIHYVVARLGNLQAGSALTRIVTIVLLFVFVVVGIWNFRLAYTAVDMGLAFAVLLLVFLLSPHLLANYYISFLIMLVPFAVVNGILTGSGIPDQVVWYNDTENLGIRLITIPVEDVAYAFSLILLNLFLFEKISDEGLFWD